jgi:hypothetical protein
VLRKPLDTNVCNIPRIPASEFTTERYVKEFEGQPKPFILTGATKGWIAHGWTRRSFRKDEKLRAVRVRGSNYGLASPGAEINVSLSDIIEHVFNPKNDLEQRAVQMRVDAHAFLDSTLRGGFRDIQWAAHQFNEQGARAEGAGARNFVRLWRQVRCVTICQHAAWNHPCSALACCDCCMVDVPPALIQKQNEYMRNLSAVMQKPRQISGVKYDMEDRYLIFGPSAAGGRPHLDVENVSFWNALVHGRKRWVFFAPVSIVAQRDVWSTHFLLVNVSMAWQGHLDALLQDEPTTVVTWMSTHPYVETALSWYVEWYEKVKYGWPWRGWFSRGPRFTLWECYQEPGDLVYGPGGMMHAVLSIKDGLGITEQIVDYTNFRGQVPWNKAKSLGLLQLGLCDSRIDVLRPQKAEQLAMLSTKPLDSRLHTTEIANPQLREVSKQDRVTMVATWLSYCAAVYHVRPDLWQSWDECKQLHDACGNFVRTELKVRPGWNIYPNFTLEKRGRSQSRRHRGDL